MVAAYPHPANLMPISDGAISTMNDANLDGLEVIRYMRTESV